MSFLDRLYRIGYAVFGPADTGPYGPPTPPPALRPRDARGRLVKPAKVAELQRLAAVAKATASASLESLVSPTPDAGAGRS